jgi:hypothetical protein
MIFLILRILKVWNKIELSSFFSNRSTRLYYELFNCEFDQWQLGCASRNLKSWPPFFTVYNNNIRRNIIS